MRKIFFLILIILIFGGIFIWQEIYISKTIGSAKPITFPIEKGEGSKEIAHKLEREGIIKWAPIFRGYVYIKGVAEKLQAGEYLILPLMTIPEIVNKFVIGDVVKEKITIIEGWNTKDIALYFENKGISSKEKFFEIINKDFSKDFACHVGSPKGDSCGDFLKDKPKNLGLEGYLFPDTYEIIKGDTLEEIVKKMLQNFDRKLTKELRDEIKKQNKTIFEIVNMASVIEKEVRTKEDKEIVSGIFWKRIKEKKPLQSCATIAYIKGVNQWRYSFEDTRIESPYNTYLNLGLSMGPISNPGIDSIKAAIFPKESEYNYFLTDSETGETLFSKTLEEHNIKKAKYLK